MSHSLSNKFGSFISPLGDLRRIGILYIYRIRGYSLSQLEIPLNLAGLDRDWCHKGPDSKYIPDVALVEARAREARVFLRDLARRAPDDAHIVVVSHGGFIHFLTEDFSGLWERYFTSYGNTTMRSFQFVDLHGDDPDAKMVQTEDSCQMSRYPRFVDMSEDERKRLRSFAVARVEWQKRDFEYMNEM